MNRGKPIATGAAGHQHFVWGLWIIGDGCRSLPARGDRSPITGDLSRFFPHRIEGLIVAVGFRPPRA